MKYKLIMLSLVSLITLISVFTTLNAQNFSIGGELGFVSSKNIDYKLSDIENRRNTYFTGLNIIYSISNKIGISTGLNYLKQGYRHTTCYIFEEGVKNELTGKLEYVILPIALNMNIGKSNKIITEIGFYGGYNIKATQDYPEPIGGCEIGYPKDISNVTQKFIFGGLVGVGYNLYENEKIQFNSLLKYYQGVSNTMKNPYTDDIIWKDKYSSLLFILSINYKLAPINKSVMPIN